jgi:hypothetical protein
VQVGPSFIDPLLANRNAAYRLAIKGAGARDVGILAITAGLLSSQAGGENPQVQNSQTLDTIPPAQPEPEVVPPVSQRRSLTNRCRLRPDKKQSAGNHYPRGYRPGAGCGQLPDGGLCANPRADAPAPAPATAPVAKSAALAVMTR